MDIIQNILAYLVLAIAVFYLVNKFLLSKPIFFGKKKSAKACGQDDCGCH